jgi:hypothetical protein
MVNRMAPENYPNLAPVNRRAASGRKKKRAFQIGRKARR